MPSFNPEDGLSPTKGTEYTREAWKEWATDLQEWIAMVQLRADRIQANDSVDPYLSTYEVTNSVDGPLKVVQLRWRGMIPARFIKKTWKELAKLIQGISVLPQENWAAMSVHGFENSIISWNNRAHSSLVGGENYYTIVGRVDASEQSIDPDAMETSETESAKAKPTTNFLSFEFVGSQDEHS